MAIAAVLPVFLFPMFGITPSKVISPDYFQVKRLCFFLFVWKITDLNVLHLTVKDISMFIFASTQQKLD